MSWDVANFFFFFNAEEELYMCVYIYTQEHKYVCMLTSGEGTEPTPVLLPGKFHGWRSLVGHSPRGR